MKKNLIFLILPFICLLAFVPANAQLVSVSQIKDVKPTDSHYKSLESLVERFGAFEPFPDGNFRANSPLTRGEFIKLLDNGLNRMMDFAAASDTEILPTDLFNYYNANKTNISAVSQIKDIQPTSEIYEPLQSLIERYGIDICDADKTFHPEKPVTEKEFYTWIKGIFGASIEGTPSETKSITRSIWVIVMNSAFEAVIERIEDKAIKNKVQKTVQPKPATVTSTPTPKATPSKSKDTDALIKEAEAFEKAGDFSNALIHYREAGDAAWDASTEMKCGIATYRIAKRLWDRDSGDDPISESRRESYKKYLKDAVDFLSSALLSDKTLVEAYKTRAAAYRLLGKTKEAEADEQKVKELGGKTSQVPQKSKLEIIQNLPSLGKAQITGKKSFYLPDNPCADLSNASADLKTAVEKGGIWGNYKMNKGDTGDIILETNNTCEKGKLVLLRIGTAIVTIGANDVKKIK
ncbi:MAG: S-layer homology domain-containing protein [Pyrinomonadaceae bacterium]|nr:S-layer homology domain-containing protein [Pyrinomonadaceae bacterium]